MAHYLFRQIFFPVMSLGGRCNRSTSDILSLMCSRWTFDVEKVSSDTELSEWDVGENNEIDKCQFKGTLINPNDRCNARLQFFHETLVHALQR